VTGKLRWFAIVSLLLLGASLAEFLTGSTRVLTAIVNPAGFALLVGLYGCGALLIREVTIGWRKRWTAVLLLGGAYAIGEEGFAAKTMTDPLGSNIGNALYSHFLGLNWQPVVGFILFHAVFSIALTLLLIELLFPETKGQRLLGKAGLVLTAVIYSLTVFLISLSEPFTPALSVTLLLSALAVVFIVAAHLVPRPFLEPSGAHPDRRERSFVLLGAGFMGAFYLLFIFAPHLLPWPVTVALYLPLAALPLAYLVKHAGRTGNEGAKVSFAIGMLLVFVPVDIGNEVNGDVGVLAFIAFAIGLLLWIRRRLKRPTLSVLENGQDRLQKETGINDEL
jgi:hypothetical protein